MGLVDRVKCALKDGATKMPVGLPKNDQKIVHEIWPTEVECKCYKCSRFFGEVSQDGYSFNVYCNPPSGKIGWGVFPVPPQDAFQAMRSFLELVVS